MKKEKKQKYICPVCGWKGLDEPAYDEEGVPSHDICACCHREFGYDDAPLEETRKKWRKSFFANLLFWKKKKQLKNLELPEAKETVEKLQNFWHNENKN